MLNKALLQYTVQPGLFMANLISRRAPSKLKVFGISIDGQQRKTKLFPKERKMFLMIMKTSLIRQLESFGLNCFSEMFKLFVEATSILKYSVYRKLI